MQRLEQADNPISVSFILLPVFLWCLLIVLYSNLLLVAAISVNNVTFFYMQKWQKDHLLSHSQPYIAYCCNGSLVGGMVIKLQQFAADWGSRTLMMSLGTPLFSMNSSPSHCCIGCNWSSGVLPRLPQENSMILGSLTWGYGRPLRRYLLSFLHFSKEQMKAKNRKLSEVNLLSRWRLNLFSFFHIHLLITNNIHNSHWCWATICAEHFMYVIFNLHQTTGYYPLRLLSPFTDRNIKPQWIWMIHNMLNANATCQMPHH